MDAPQVAVPAIPGIDLAFRPRTYFGPIPAETHLLAHATGHERREFLRAQLATDGDDPMLDLLAGLFEYLDRESLGRIHPTLMGGEYLRPFLENETEIARISFVSTTADPEEIASVMPRSDEAQAPRSRWRGPVGDDRWCRVTTCLPDCRKPLTAIVEPATTM